MNRRIKFSLFVFVSLILLVVFCISPLKSNALNAFSDSVIVSFTTDSTQSSKFKLKVARTMTEKARGLMYVKNLPEDEGMLFIYDEEDVHNFWMKNTFIPLDMIFINSEKEVVGIIKNTTILSEETLSINKPSRYIIEVNAGVAEKNNIDVGSKVNGEFW